MVTSRDLKTEQNGNIQIGNKSFETVEQFKYLGTTLTDQNSIYEEIKEYTEIRKCLLALHAECFVF